MKQVVISPRTLLTALGIGALVYFAWVIRDVILVVMTSVVIASFVNYPIALLQKMKIPRVVSSLVLYILIFGILGFLVYSMIPVFVSELQSLGQLFPQDSRLAELVGVISGPGIDGVVLNPADGAKQTIGIATEFISLFHVGSVFGGVQGFFLSFLNIILVIMLSFYLSVQQHNIEQFIRVITPIEHEAYVLGLWRRVHRKIGLWFRGQLVLALIEGALIFIGLSLAAVPYSLLLAALAAVAALIPFGMVLAALPAIAIAFLSGGSTLGIITFAIYFIVHQFESYVLHPFIVNRSTGIPPVLTIIAIVCGATAAGFFGVLLSVPITVLLLELLADHEKKRAPREA